MSQSNVFEEHEATSFGAALSKLWSAYNAEGSWLPLALPLLFWASTWVMYRIMLSKDYSKWYNIHTLHHVLGIVLGSLSLYLQDNTIFHERIGIFWSMSYFIVDVVECLYVGHLSYVLHGAICLGLGLCNYNIPLLLQLRMNSKAVFIESSSILLNQVKQNRNPTLFLLFAVIYTLCRIVWVPFIGKELLDNGLEWQHPIILTLALFYALQVYWWIKILKIAIEGDGKKPKTHEASSEKEA